jgi:hypothetical protein
MSKKVLTKKELEILTENSDESVKFVEKKKHPVQVNGGNIIILFLLMVIYNNLYLVIHVKHYWHFHQQMVPTIYVLISIHAQKQINQVLFINELFMISILLQKN